MLTEAETSRFAQVGSLKLHYNEAGEGPALVFTIGFAPGTSAWLVYHRVIDRLSRHFRCLLLDPPNTGRSDALVMRGEARSTLYARIIREFIDTLKLESTTLVDMAFGAQVGLAFALDSPGRVDSLILHSCAMRMPPLFYNAPTDAMLALRRAFASPSRRSLRDMMNLYLYDGESHDDASLMIEERLALWSRRPDCRQALRASENIGRMFGDQLKTIRAPTLLMAGRDDRVLGGVEGALMLLNHLDDARLVIFNRCGHWIPFERPDEFCRMACGFLDVGVVDTQLVEQ